MLSGVQAAALLIAAKRADAIASEIAIHTEKNTEELKALMQENTTLTMQVKSNTDLLEEIHRHVTALTETASVPPDPGDDAKGRPPST
jgi:phage-related minor tail protein